MKWLCKQPGETHALSNSHFGDRSWPKVVKAENAVALAMNLAAAQHASKESIIKTCLEILRKDTLPRRKVGEDWEIYLQQLKHSVYVPAIGLAEQKALEEVNKTATPRSSTPVVNGGALKGADALANGSVNGHAHVVEATHGVYGTQKQSVILVDWEGRVTFFERTLFGTDGVPIEEGEGDRMFVFQIEDW